MSGAQRFKLLVFLSIDLRLGLPQGHLARLSTALAALSKLAITPR
jgi:hypothetical protein